MPDEKMVDRLAKLITRESVPGLVNSAVTAPGAAFQKGGLELTKFSETPPIVEDLLALTAKGASGLGDLLGGGLKFILGDKKDDSERLENIDDNTEETSESVGELVKQNEVNAKQDEKARLAEIEALREASRDPKTGRFLSKKEEKPKDDSFMGWVTMLSLLGTLITGFLTLLMTDFDTFFKTIGGLARKAFTRIGNLGRGMLTQIGEMGTKIMTHLRGVYDDVLKPILINLEKKFLKPFTKFIAETFDPFIKRTTAALKPLLDAAVKAARPLAERVGSAVNPLKGALIKTAGQASSMLGRGSEVAGNLAKKTAGMGKGVLGKIPMIGAAIESFFLKGDYDRLQELQKAGKITEKEASDYMMTKVLGSVAALAGGAGGAVVGSAAGPVGTVAGAVIAGEGARYGAESLARDFVGTGDGRMTAIADMLANPGSAGGATTTLTDNSTTTIDNSITQQQQSIVPGNNVSPDPPPGGYVPAY